MHFFRIETQLSNYSIPKLVRIYFRTPYASKSKLIVKLSETENIFIYFILGTRTPRTMK